MWALAVHCASLVAIVASDDESVVSVASLAQPGIELSAAADSKFTAMGSAIIVHVVEAEEL
jgi:hypothetical protein